MNSKEQQYKEMLELVATNLSKTMSKSLQKLQARVIKEFLKEQENEKLS